MVARRLEVLAGRSGQVVLGQLGGMLGAIGGVFPADWWGDVLGWKEGERKVVQVQNWVGRGQGREECVVQAQEGIGGGRGHCGILSPSHA